MDLFSNVELVRSVRYTTRSTLHRKHNNNYSKQQQCALRTPINDTEGVVATIAAQYGGFPGFIPIFVLRIRDLPSEIFMLQTTPFSPVSSTASATRSTAPNTGIQFAVMSMGRQIFLWSTSTVLSQHPGIPWYTLGYTSLTHWVGRLDGLLLAHAPKVIRVGGFRACTCAAVAVRARHCWSPLESCVCPSVRLVPRLLQPRVTRCWRFIVTFT